MEDETEDEGVLEVDSDGNKTWRDKKNRYHRLNGPAIIWYDGDMDWYCHGCFHRDDGPARDWPSDGLKEWWKHDKLHRDDGPAIIYPTEGIEEWYKDDEPYEPSAHEIMLWKMKKES